MGVKCIVDEPIDIFQNADKKFFLDFTDEKDNPIDISTADDIKFLLEKTDPPQPFTASKVGTEITNVSGQNNRVQVLLSEAQTATILAGELLDAEIELIENTDETTIIQLEKAVNVKKRLFT